VVGIGSADVDYVPLSLGNGEMGVLAVSSSSLVGDAGYPLFALPGCAGQAWVNAPYGPNPDKVFVQIAIGSPPRNTVYRPDPSQAPRDVYWSPAGGSQGLTSGCRS